MSYRVVWFKRDLRVQDHAALCHAARLGPVLCLYVLEPELWRQPDMALQHHNFTKECLRDLYKALKHKGLVLQVVSGQVTEVLEALYRQAPFLELVSHEETGNAWTYERDKAVLAWCRSKALPWRELAQFGVVRRLRSRDQWTRHWQAHHSAALQALDLDVPLQSVALPWSAAPLPSPTALGLGHVEPPQRQRGGTAQALQVLHDFISQRSLEYRGGISSPLSAPTACSRLSPYLSLGCVSTREVVQITQAAIAQLPPGHQRKGLASFLSRLHWHCHFIQKLEDEPSLEERNMHRGYDGLRESEWNEAHFAALTQGRTGWPLVDACVHMLADTGWLNFRMRAMLVSVASYPLWLHWRSVGQWLAQQFLDYEPGIHWSQMQMQSGTTGINTTRVYNPIKQAQDHDPQGHFVRRYLPWMRRVPPDHLFEPWRMPLELQAQCSVQVGRDIPMPLVDLKTATQTAKQRLHDLRAQPEVKAAKAEIVKKHASRKRASPAKTVKGSRKPARSSRARTASSEATAPPLPAQLGLF
jgi:deoxyribodipyrimidine photo-lyase